MHSATSAASDSNSFSAIVFTTFSITGESIFTTSKKTAKKPAGVGQRRGWDSNPRALGLLCISTLYIILPFTFVGLSPVSK